MKKNILIFLINIFFFGNMVFAQEKLSLEQNFSYNKYEPIAVCFFPIEKSRWNGYEVLSRDWKLLDKYQKSKFASEAIEEIKVKEKVNIPSGINIDSVISALDTANAFVALTGDRQPVITILLKILVQQGLVEGKIKSGKDSPVMAAMILDQMRNKGDVSIFDNKNNLGTGPKGTH